MKTSFIILLLSCLACSRQVGLQHTHQNILIDVTDTNMVVVELTASEIMRSLPISVDMYSGAKVNLTPITDFRLNSPCTVSIPAVDILTANELARLNEIDTFKSKISRCLGTIQHMPIGRKGSLIFASVVKVLNDMQGYQAFTHQELYLMSDLAETGAFNSYDPVVLEDLERNPDKYIAMIDQAYPLIAEVGDMEVVLVYKPRSQDDDARYAILSAFTLKYLLSKGIRGTVRTTFNE